MYTYVEPLFCTPETNIMLHIYYNSIFFTKLTQMSQGWTIMNAVLCCLHSPSGLRAYSSRCTECSHMTALSLQSSRRIAVSERKQPHLRSCHSDLLLWERNWPAAISIHHCVCTEAAPGLLPATDGAQHDASACPSPWSHNDLDDQGQLHLPRRWLFFLAGRT